MRGAQSLFNSSQKSWRGQYQVAALSTSSLTPHTRQSNGFSPQNAVESALGSRKAVVKKGISMKRLRQFDVVVTPPPIVEPPLLLEGDNYCISGDGTAKTLYRLKSKLLSPSQVSIEESFDLQNARKSFTLRKDNEATFLYDQSTKESIRLGEAICRLDLQEIVNGVLGSAGTGATTWESSILMSMYFSMNPGLSGDIVELGSGVGLGGILLAVGACRGWNEVSSLTLTDYNTEVLEQCHRNVRSVYSGATPISVDKLDWYDYILPVKTSRRFDTIIASDCAYNYSDIGPLVATMKALLRDQNSRVHVFGPQNRGGLQELLRHLRDEAAFEVTTYPVEMERIRLRPAKLDRKPSNGLKHTTLDYSIASTYVSTYLHIVCAPTEESRRDVALSEID